MRVSKVVLWTLLLGIVLWAGWLALGAVVSARFPQVTAVFYLGQGQSRGQGNYSVVGPPTISASFIDRVLVAYRSPAVGLGPAIYAQGVRYGIDPVYALAFFQHESSFGTTGEARVTFSPGNERCIADRPCLDRDRGGYAQMQSWADGFDHWYRLIRYGYVQGQINRDIGRAACPCTTVATIIPVYAPSSDGNDEAGYIAAVEQAADAWRKGQVWA